MDCAISVIVPIFNAEKWLLRCLNRILHQPFHSFELLLVNDGSTDQSGALCEEFAASDSRIKVLHKPNGGTSSAKNAGLQAASGKYVVFLDADDAIDESYFVKLYATAEEHACDIVMSGYETVPNKLSVVPGFQLHTLMNGKQFVLSSPSVHSGNDLCFVWRSLFLRDMLKKNEVLFHEGLTVGEDTIFHLQALLSAKRVYAIPDPLYFYTVNNLDSLMSCPYKPYLEKSLSLQYELRQRLSEKSGLLAHKHYKKDMAAYHIRSILGMLLRNVRNSPIPVSKSDVARVINLNMITRSTKELSFTYACPGFKEYLYYLAIKFKWSAVLFRWEFHPPAVASFLSFGILGRSKRMNNRTFR
ncbi:glycosyltransferase family 2 protein [Paenibacillus paridis]|uniref:glycosyltransferase family 2 protein n=1 Tax=Paenibacillus paridis TaxID=2583376 RepID=UPI00111FE85A|nr:glycosyltransferase [Paenibacillus paridis]